MHSKLHIKMFPKIVPPACRSIVFFHKDPNVFLGSRSLWLMRAVTLSLLGASPAWGFLPPERRDAGGLSGMSWTEDILRYLGSSSSQIKGRREGSKRVGWGGRGRNEESREQSRR